MASGINFSLLIEMLQFLRDHHGRSNHFDDRFRNRQDFSLTAFYMHEHRLVEGRFPTSVNPKAKIVNVTITGKGLDLLEPSGGLTALMNTRTIRFEPDQIRQAMEVAIKALQATPQEKESLLSALRNLGEETLKEAWFKLVELGIKNAPNAVEILLNLFGSSGSPPTSGRSDMIV